MESTQHTCRLCGGTGLAAILRLENAPPNISFMLRPEQFERDRPITLDVLHCDECGFVQTFPQFEVEQFYEDYLMTTSHSPQMQAFQRQQASDFVTRFNLRGKKIIEVGCGDGNYLEHLKALGTEAVGNEPSARFRKHAITRGFTVYEGYVGRALSIPGAPYDGFVTRQVLEHVPDVNDFLLGIRRSLKPGGYGLIEVPSLEQAMEGVRFYDFFSDHLNYFSARTLRLAAERNGFNVIEVARGMGGEYNVALVQADPQFNYAGFRDGVALVLQDLREFMARCSAEKKKVAVWGAGGKGVTSLAISRLTGVKYVVDSDKFKHGLHTPVTHLPIHPPSRLSEDPVDVIILTALAYKNEIIADLRTRLNFKGTIAALGARLEIVQP